MVKEVIQKASIFYGINDRTLAVHLLQVLCHVLRKLHMLKKRIKHPV
jgi:hypothetical protein